MVIFLNATSLISPVLATTNDTTNLSLFNVDLCLAPWPRTIVLDGKRMFNAKVALAIGDNPTTLALESLIEQADGWLGAGPWTVTNKNNTTPSGDKHDYTSQSGYFWPSTNSSNGCPYVIRDGLRNPEADKWTDGNGASRMMESSYILSLAWYYTDREAYARHASRILQTWFLDETTRMNPNMYYSQMIPCLGVDDNPYAFSGLIDLSHAFTSVLDSVSILDSTKAPGWAKENTVEFKKWSNQFLSWLTESKTGRSALTAFNNHGNFAGLMGVALGMFVGNNSISHKLLLDTRPRIDDSFSSNGSQPHELIRTRSFHYSTFSLVAFTRLAALGEKMSVDLWGYTGPGGQSILKAIEFLVPAALDGQDVWPYPDIGFQRFAANNLIQAASEKGSEVAQNALASGKLEKIPRGDLWTLRPVVEQLDPVSPLTPT